MNNTMKNIISLINQAVADGEIPREAGSAASRVLVLKGDEAVLANRMLIGGDPFAYEYLLKGEVSDKVRAAHYAGPGVYSVGDPDRQHYLSLIALSADESKTATQRERVLEIAQALSDLGALNNSIEEDRTRYLQEIAEAEDERILKTPMVDIEVGGVVLPVGTSDRVFARAYWSGWKCAGVYHVHPVGGPGILVGCDGKTLEDLGIKCDKVIKPDLGVITDPATLEEVKLALLGAYILKESEVA